MHDRDPRTWRRALVALVCLVVAAGSYLGATGLLESLYAYRSPLPATIGPQAVTTAAPTTPATPRLARKVVAVLVDGLRVDTAADTAVMPFLAELRSRGASTQLTVHTPSYSVPGWTVLMTGAWIEQHGGMAMNPSDPSLAPTWVQDNVFTAAHDAGLRTGVSGTDWFAPLIPKDALTSSSFVHDETDAADQASTDTAKSWLSGDQVDFLLVHLNEVDHAGHHSGGGTSPAWRTAATKADARLREIAGTLDLSKDAMVVFSDHGHLDPGGHGGPEDIVTHSPFVMAGAGVRPGVALDPAQQVDCGPTIAALLGVRVLHSAVGGALVGGLTLDDAGRETLRAAQAAQQADLVKRYADALHVSAGTVAPADPTPVATGQAQLASARSTLLGQDRAGRAIPVGVAALLLLGAVVAFAWRRRMRFGWALAGAAAYWAFFHGVYDLLERRTYSLSSVTSANDVILATADATVVGLIAAWLVAAVGRRLGRGGRRRIVTTVGDVFLVVGATLAVPVLVGVYLGGWRVTWAIPDPLPMFLQFFSMLQLLVIAVLSLLAGIVGVLLTRGRPSPV